MKLFGVMLGWACSLVVLITFYIALFHDYSVLVKINSFGEAWLEAPIVLIAFVLSTFAFGHELSGHRER